MCPSSRQAGREAGCGAGRRERKGEEGPLDPFDKPNGEGGRWAEGDAFYLAVSVVSEPPASDLTATLRRDLFCMHSIVRSKQSGVSCVW